MNYYPFHIGDYASATRHLSWDEDLAYRRLLDVYYTSEKPLPEDLRQVCRLVLATTESQRDAVQVVLAEFFELTAEGWTSARADAEIVAMLEKQQKQRDRANKRWNKPSGDAGNAATDATAMPPTPTPTPTPTPNIDKSASAQRAKPAVVTQPEGVSDSVWQDFLAIRKANRAPLTQTALDGIGREASKAGITLAQALSICCTRGWRSFNASWKWRDEATEQTGETPYQRSMRERVQQMAPAIASRSHLRAMPAVQFFEGQAIEVEAKQLGMEP